MSSHDRLQQNRFEHKYLIDERRAQAVRDFVRAQLRPDSHMDPSQPDGYMVYSIYLDSGDLQLCRATVAGEKNRFKLRMRYYDSQPGSPVFCEVKRRVNDAIIKSRAPIHRSNALELIAGASPHNGWLTNPASDKSQAALGDFCQLRDKLGARPISIVAYRREAYMSITDGDARLTMDRELRGSDWAGRFDDLHAGEWRRTAVQQVILELKFTHRFPLWMSTLAQRFELQRQSVPKYVECVHALRDPRVSSAGNKLGHLAAHLG